MWFDKLVIALISPLGTALLLWAMALLMFAARWGHLVGFAGVGARAKQAKLQARWAYALAAGATLWLLLWSLPVVSHGLRAQLEQAYPPVPMAQVPQARAIVLLGGGMRPAEQPGEMPDMGSAADRVWLAARLYKAGKAPVLILSGGSDRAVSATSEAQAMRELLLDMGVPDAALVLEEQSRNTRDNAALVAQWLRQHEPGAAAPGAQQRILLVTSALHMRRAMALFEAQGLQPVAASADHQARRRFAAVDWLPDADALDGSARAMKEWVGRLAGR
jgi:uncharacterized SAM-binding protein YcdF (DUF218 family)